MVPLPNHFELGSQPAIVGSAVVEPWIPMYWLNATFSAQDFHSVMQNLIRNPNLNSNHLCRGDILLDKPDVVDMEHQVGFEPQVLHLDGFSLEQVIVRRLIPRNRLVDKEMDQSCLVYRKDSQIASAALVIYIPHIRTAQDMPFYHPAVKGIGFLYERASSGLAKVSIHYQYFDDTAAEPQTARTAQHLLSTLYKHGNGAASGYQKRVRHDAVLPQATVQNTYAKLKSKYARQLITDWIEVTDPAKHVFEDLGIAAFLIELWSEMYQHPTKFPGFVDIGCGNGYLVHILIEEGYAGWGFDARERQSWKKRHSATAQENLKELVLIPGLARQKSKPPISLDDPTTITKPVGIHDGVFPKGTFIISNHADELTPWTPILAAQSQCPFIAIPCCSHNLTGARCRARSSRTTTGATSSAYSSLVTWVKKLAEECGWAVETEMLRIPSTRNTALIGRTRSKPFDEISVADIVQTHGGADGWEVNALKLLKGGERGH